MSRAAVAFWPGGGSRFFINNINFLPHAEEPAKPASRSIWQRVTPWSRWSKTPPMSRYNQFHAVTQPPPVSGCGSYPFPE